MKVYDLAKKYYPRRWSEDRIHALVEAGRLTPEEAEAILTDEEGTG